MKTQPCEAGTLVLIYYPHTEISRKQENQMKDNGLLCMICELLAISLLFKSESTEAKIAIMHSRCFESLPNGTHYTSFYFHPFLSFLLNADTHPGDPQGVLLTFVTMCAQHTV